MSHRGAWSAAAAAVALGAFGLGRAQAAGERPPFLATDGRLSIIAFLGGTKATLDMGEILYRRLTLTGSTLRPRSIEYKAQVAAALREKVWPLLEAGTLQPVIYRTFPLDQAAAAHALMESSVHIGKILLEVPPAAA